MNSCLCRNQQQHACVTLFDGGKTVREWYCPQASSYKGTAYFTPEGQTLTTVVAGSFIIEPL